MSFGPISWLLVGEVFPLKVRGQAIALATITNFASNFAVSLALPTVQQAVGQSGEVTNTEGDTCRVCGAVDTAQPRGLSPLTILRPMLSHIGM